MGIGTIPPKIKITFITSGLGTGGAESMLLRLLQHLDKDIFFPQVVSLTNKGSFGAKIEGLSIPVIPIHMTIFTPWRFFKLASILRQLKPDMVQTWMYHANLMGGVAASIAGVAKVFWGIRQSDLRLGYTKFSTLFIARFSAVFSKTLPKKIITCSNEACRIHIKAGYDAKKMVMIPNGFDLEKFTAKGGERETLRSELGLGKNALLVGLIARYHPQKNHLGFVDAMKHVHEKLPHVHFVLAGLNVDKNNAPLNEKIHKNVLQKNTHLLGKREDIPSLMAGLDVLACSSMGESFPNTLGEAMASGIPCVTTDAGDAAEIVGSADENTGRVVAVGDMMALGNALIEILTLPKEKRMLMGKNALERIKERYNICKVVKHYEAVYKNLPIESSN